MAHSRMRRRLLDGTWREDLARAIRARVGTTRAEAWSDAPILESNVYASICRELSVLYAEPPTIAHPTAPPEVVADLAERLRRAGLWGLMQRVQRYTLGMRECLVRIDVENGRPTFRPVYPDMVWGVAREDAPDQPAAIYELRRRTLQGKTIWTVDVIDADGLIYENREARGTGEILGQDLTEAWHPGGRSGDAYPFRRGDGSAILPYILYHAERTGDRLWDPWTWAELVDGSISLAVKSNMLDHTFVSASWPQRYGIGVRPAGMGAVDGRRAEVITDPSTLLLLEREEGFDGQPVVGQFQAGGDVDKMAAVLEAEAARIAVEAGVSASDIQRLNSQRSGVSISLSNEGKRAQQRRFASHFRDADERLVATTAALLNRAAEAAGAVGPYPEYGYEVAYRELALSPDELDARRRDVLERQERGLLSRVGAYMELHPGISRTTAERDLAMIDAERVGGDIGTELAAALEALAGGDYAAAEESLRALIERSGGA